MHKNMTRSSHVHAGCFPFWALLLALADAAQTPNTDAPRCTLAAEVGGELDTWADELGVPHPVSLLQIAKDKGHLSRSVVQFEPAKWNGILPLRKSHNCYEYALNDIDSTAVDQCSRLIKAHGRTGKTYKKCRHFFHIPGYHWHQKGLKKPLREAVKFNHSACTCQNVLQRVALDGKGALLWADEHRKPTKAVDNRGVKSWKHDDLCPKDHYMASLVVRPHHRFHFYRRDRPCADPENKGKLCWTHKPGLLNVTHLDGSKKEIPNLHAADRSYGKHSYNEVCGFFCVPSNNVAETHSDFFRGRRDHIKWASV